ncbi:MAG: DUF3566 domain-containing protein [Ilumatobacter sp.]|uniref:DUF3566 domain-containing protein n=1 Tax=Ilumatobacter sp. TaxID=1967498 RepID=UPI0026344EC1|nr:DUF3566 domain-containing protein [Ilumatobacter sp.]MDJ0771440.1 DUF3566 domain-containing protein [Ilumatobacter sp.]
MSTTDGDASSRLSEAIEQILAKTAPTDDAPAPDGDTDPADADDDERADASASTAAGAPDAGEVPPSHSAPAADQRAAEQPADQPAPDQPAPEQPAPELPTEVVPTLPARSADPARPATTEPTTAPKADWSVDDDGDVPYELPEIVPATQDAPPTARQPASAPPSGAPSSTPAPPAPATATPPSPAAAKPSPTTSWADHMAPVAPAGAPLRQPGRRPRVRRVTRVLRHIDPWSTFKVALLFSAVAYVVTLTAGVLLWRVADRTGTLANIERWFTQFGWETFELKGGEIFANAWVIGLFGVVAMTGAVVLLATLFNLVSDIVGGVRVTVLEEEVVERTVSSTRRYVVRRPPTGAATGWDVDGDDPDDGATRSASAAATTADWSVDDDDDQDGQDGDRVDDAVGTTTDARDPAAGAAQAR